MYPWQLTREVTLSTMHPELPTVHATRESLIEPIVRSALAHRPDARVVDLGCHEGYFAHRVLAWGAGSVVAVDVRDVNIRRATLLREHFAISPERLELRRASVYDLRPEELGRFDVVLVLGLIYHLENPIGSLRLAGALATPGGLVVVEAQLHRGGPVQAGRGVTGETGEPAFTEEAATWAAKFEPLHEQEGTPLAAYGGVISLIPNAAAVVQALEVIGLERVHRLEAGKDHNLQYRLGDRGVFVGYAPRS
jgi:tRNA (mo5U34)-methyltransferase